MKVILFIVLYGFAVTVPWTPKSSSERSERSKNGMTVQWQHEHSFVRFALSAPTHGWLAIGFNENSDLSGTYLIMARVRDGFVQITEHKVLQPGKYLPVMELGGKAMIFDCQGQETADSTIISFCIPTGLYGACQKDLSSGLPYHFTMAYSRSDDFQHHSVMRTSERMAL